MIINILLNYLIFSLLIQFAFFIFAYIFRTDKLTDFTYGLTFIILSFWAFFRSSDFSLGKIVLVLMISIWGIRLISYLLTRILKIKRDKRFDEIRINFVKFLSFWVFQGISVFIILIPSLVFLNKNQSLEVGFISILGIIIFILGLSVETIADMQKFNFKLKNKDKWIESGIWKYSRHPNYFGEMTTWWGIFIFLTPFLSGIEYLSIIGPMFISFILLFVSGVPILEKRYEEKYGKNKDYIKYKNSTSLIIPLPKKA